MADRHPIFAADEQEPGIWIMADPGGKWHAIVRILRRGGELGYSAVTRAEISEERQLSGYYRSLRGATMAAHMQFIGARGAEAPVNGRLPRIAH